MVQEKGTISIHTENIFPIIKKFYTPIMRFSA
jgi:hypothetical protein